MPCKAKRPVSVYFTNKQILPFRFLSSRYCLFALQSSMNLPGKQDTINQCCSNVGVHNGTQQWQIEHLMFFG